MGSLFKLLTFPIIWPVLRVVWHNIDRCVSIDVREGFSTATVQVLQSACHQVSASISLLHSPGSAFVGKALSMYPGMCTLT